MLNSCNIDQFLYKFYKEAKNAIKILLLFVSFSCLSHRHMAVALAVAPYLRTLSKALNNRGLAPSRPPAGCSLLAVCLCLILVQFIAFFLSMHLY